VIYRLSPAGVGLFPVIQAMANWALENQ
jgi:DNA-binding HxlR family transcriptional regulator